MPPLTITIEVPWPKHPSFAALEKAIFSALMSAGRELLKMAFQAIEARLLADGAGARQRRRRRYVITRFGELRFARWQTRGPGGYRHPLDDALYLPAKEQCSPWVKAKAARLAQAHPYRQAAALLSDMIGTKVDHRRLWGWVQHAGNALTSCWRARRDALFADGELPAVKGGAPAIVSTGVDGTFIQSRAGPIEVKLGIWWTGAHRASLSARHPRWVRERAGCYATTDDADSFGQTFYLLAEQAVGISRATDIFAISDGAGWCPEIFAEWVRPTHHQLDHFHGKQRITEVARDPDRAARWWAWVAESNLDALGRSINAYIRSGHVDSEAGRNLLAYFEKGAAALNTYFQLRAADTARRWLRAARVWSSTTSSSSSPVASSARRCARGAGRAPTTCSPFRSSRKTARPGARGGVMRWSDLDTRPRSLRLSRARTTAARA